VIRQRLGMELRHLFGFKNSSILEPFFTAPWFPASKNVMPDKFDPYRESLVVETETDWPEEYDDWEPREQTRVARMLHENPKEASHLEYLRMHTGFCRRIVVTSEDIQRVT